MSLATKGGPVYQYSKDALGGPPRLRTGPPSLQQIVSQGRPPKAPTTPRKRVVLVRRKKKNHNKLLLPLGALAALLATGGTVGLWLATSQYEGATVTAGDLDLAITQNLTWYDVSPDRHDTDDENDYVGALNLLTDNKGFYTEFFNVCDFDDGDCILNTELIENELGGSIVSGKPTFEAPHDKSAFQVAHLIECIDEDGTCAGNESWKMVPGDTIVGLIKAKLTLEGDNLVAGLEYECDDMSEEQLAALGALTSGDIGELVQVRTDLYLNSPFAAPPATPGEPFEPLAHMLPGPRGPFLGYFEAPVEGQSFGAPDATWVPGTPIVTTLVSDPEATAEHRLSVGTGEVTLMITIHFSENADERELAALPLAQVFSGRLSLTQVRGIDTPGQFLQSS